MGTKHKAKVSRYENGHRIPPLRTALAYATILGVPLPKLFPHLQRELQTEIASRILDLQAKLEKAPTRKRGARRAARMFEWLKQRHAGITANKSS